MKFVNDFLKFLNDSKTAFHACFNIEKILIDNGFIKLSENEKWNLKEGKYFISRNNASILAFTIPSNLNELSYNITAAHLDSPTFKLKPNFKLDEKRYNRLNTEVYGGPIYNTWMDRGLDIAGRVFVKEDNKIVSKLFSFDRAVALIPNLPIHYNREVNKGVALNPQIDLIPLIGDKENIDVNLLDEIAKKLKIEKNNILSYDLFLSLLERGYLAGINNDFIMAPQIDNLECSYALTKALIDSKNNKSINVLALFDSEEIGSRTRDGAGSTLLKDALERISYDLGLNLEEHKIALANSFIVSADNAQGYHPNYPSKYDPTNASYLNSGIVIKNAARGSYTTDALSSSYFKEICKNACAKYQDNTNRSDVPGGSTLGAISLGLVSIPSVDIGLAQLAMHSSFETAGAYDLDDLIKAIKEFYDTHLTNNKDGELSYELCR